MNGVEILVQRQAIADQLYRYCRGLDRMDKAMAQSVFHPEAQVVYEGRFEGSAYGFLDEVWVGHGKLIRHSHHLTNIYVEIDGDEAVSETYVIVLLRTVAEGGAYMRISSGRYLDRWTSDAGKWVINRRRYVPEFNETPGSVEDKVALEVTSSRRDEQDPSFEFFAPTGAMFPDPGGGGRFLEKASPKIAF